MTSDLPREMKKEGGGSTKSREDIAKNPRRQGNVSSDFILNKLKYASQIFNICLLKHKHADQGKTFLHQT